MKTITLDPIRNINDMKNLAKELQKIMKIRVNFGFYDKHYMHRYIKIKLFDSMYAGIKFSNPGGSKGGYLVHGYTNNASGSLVEYIASENISIYEKYVDKQVENFCTTFVDSLCKMLSDWHIDDYPFDDVTITHNLHDKLPSPLFRVLKFTNTDSACDDIDKCKLFISYLLENMSEINNMAFIRLHTSIDAGIDKNIESDFEIAIQYSKLFGSDTYSVSIEFPRLDEKYDNTDHDDNKRTGLDPVEMAQGVLSCMGELIRLSEHFQCPGDSAEITFNVLCGY
jgi:hypothetical protein